MGAVSDASGKSCIGEYIHIHVICRQLIIKCNKTSSNKRSTFEEAPISLSLSLSLNLQKDPLTHYIKCR